MSIQAVAWAIEQQEVTEPEMQLVLICLANYAGANGANAFPALSRLVRDTRLSERTVRRQLRKLEAMSLICKGNQAIVAAHIQRADRRPTVYDLVLSRGVTDAPRSSTGGPPDPNGGSQTTCTGGPGGPQSVNPDPSLNHKRESARAIPTGSGANPGASKERREEFKRQVRELAKSPFPIQRKKV